MQLLLHTLHPDHIDFFVLGELYHRRNIDGRGVCRSVYFVLGAVLNLIGRFYGLDTHNMRLDPKLVKFPFVAFPGLGGVVRDEEDLLLCITCQGADCK